jgi:hypothetical protein
MITKTAQIVIVIVEDEPIKNGDLVYASEKKQNSQPNVFVYDSTVDYSNFYSGRFYKIIQSFNAAEN